MTAKNNRSGRDRDSQKQDSQKTMEVDETVTAKINRSGRQKFWYPLPNRSPLFLTAPHEQRGRPPPPAPTLAYPQTQHPGCQCSCEGYQTGLSLAGTGNAPDGPPMGLYLLFDAVDLMDPLWTSLGPTFDGLSTNFCMHVPHSKPPEQLWTSHAPSIS